MIYCEAEDELDRLRRRGLRSFEIESRVLDRGDDRSSSFLLGALCITPFFLSFALGAES